ncbi:MAG: hypothetical protein IJY74_06220, partial [Oscillospiraceae bacterium]|nr:hypothetical protein [Oscillospiraceae bacterium]
STGITKLMLEFSDSASDFEPYSGKTYTPNENGVVEDLTSLSPMTIFTDTDGATVECDYVVDTNVVINKLIAAIVALGGSV